MLVQSYSNKRRRPGSPPADVRAPHPPTSGLPERGPLPRPSSPRSKNVLVCGSRDDGSFARAPNRRRAREAFFFPDSSPNLLKTCRSPGRRISTIISAGSNRSDPTWNLSRFVRVGPARARALAGASRVASGSSIHRRSRARHPRSERGVRTVNVVCWFAFSMPARSREKEEKSASRSDARANQREGASPETRP
jgi:hypothetical protein